VVLMVGLSLLLPVACHGCRGIAPGWPALIIFSSSPALSADLCFGRGVSGAVEGRKSDPTKTAPGKT
jgi:hypothetical protein